MLQLARDMYGGKSSGKGADYQGLSKGNGKGGSRGFGGGFSSQGKGQGKGVAAAAAAPGERILKEDWECMMCGAVTWGMRDGVPTTLCHNRKCALEKFKACDKKWADRAKAAMEDGEAVESPAPNDGALGGVAPGTQSKPGGSAAVDTPNDADDTTWRILLRDVAIPGPPRELITALPNVREIHELLGKLAEPKVFEDREGEREAPQKDSLERLSRLKAAQDEVTNAQAGVDCVKLMNVPPAALEAVELSLRQAKNKLKTAEGVQLEPALSKHAAQGELLAFTQDCERSDKRRMGRQAERDLALDSAQDLCKRMAEAWLWLGEEAADTAAHAKKVHDSNGKVIEEQRAKTRLALNQLIEACEGAAPGAAVTCAAATPAAGAAAALARLATGPADSDDEELDDVTADYYLEAEGMHLSDLPVMIAHPTTAQVEHLSGLMAIVAHTLVSQLPAMTYQELGTSAGTAQEVVGGKIWAAFYASRVIHDTDIVPRQLMMYLERALQLARDQLLALITLSQQAQDQAAGNVATAADPDIRARRMKTEKKGKLKNKVQVKKEEEKKSAPAAGTVVAGVASPPSS